MLKGGSRRNTRAKHYSESTWNAPLECSQPPCQVDPGNSHHTRPAGIRPQAAQSLQAAFPPSLGKPSSQN